MDMIKKPIKIGGMEIIIKELSDNSYIIINDIDGSWILNKKMDYAEAVRRFDGMRRKAELLNSGYEYKETIELTNGFKRVPYFHKEFSAVMYYLGDIYIYSDGDKVHLLVNVRYMGEDYSSSFESDDIVNITDAIIKDRIEDVKTTIRKVIDGNEL